MAEQSRNWRAILWREWRYSADEVYAQNLFNLVADEPVGWGGLVSLALLGTLYGQIAGVLLKLLTPGSILPSPLAGGDISLFVWLGGILGGAGSFLLSGGRLSWRTWLAWLTPAAFWGKIGQSDRPNNEWWLGIIVGLAGLGIGVGALVGFLVAILSGRKYEVSRGNEYVAGGAVGALAGGLGALAGVLAGQGGALGAGLGLILGIWAGAVWGSGLIGVLIGWLVILIGWLFFGIGDWMTGWLGLSLGYGLGTLLKMGRYKSDSTDNYAFRSWYFWWQGQPLIAKVEAALRQAVVARPEAQAIWAGPLHYLKQHRAQPGQPGLFIEALQSLNWIDRFAARHALVNLGGETTAALQQIAADTGNSAQPAALWVLSHIEQETTHRLAWRLPHLLCPRCLARFARRVVNLPWGIAFTYYGCRLCDQSQEFLEGVNRTVAVLDRNWSEPSLQQDNQLRVNWLKHRTPFDFERVEIIQASDEEVERFAVQIGNDTDPLREPRYREMICTIGPECYLSENTLRILEHTFGEVTVHAPHL